MKRNIMVFLVLFGVLSGRQIHAQSTICVYPNPKTPPAGTYSFTVKVNGEGQGTTYGGTGNIPDSLKYQKLNISMGHDTGENKTFSKSLSQGIQQGDTLGMGTFDADNPMKYIRINSQSDSDSNVFNSFYVLNYFSDNGCIYQVVKLIPDSTDNFVSDGSFNFQRIDTTIILPPPPGSPPPPPPPPPSVRPFVNDTVFKKMIAHNYISATGDTCKIKIDIHPVIKTLGLYNNDIDMLPTHDRIILKAPIKYPKLVYRWQYRLENLPDTTPAWSNHLWTDFPDSVNYSETISLCMRDLMDSATYMPYLNRAIYIRIKTCNGSSDIIVKNIRLSAPKITQITPIRTKCVYTNDGSVKLKFNRPASYKGEQFFLIFNKSDGKNTTVFTDTLSASNGVNYTSPAIFEAGDYELQVYGTLDTKSINSIKTPTFNACHYKFTIENPEPVEFETSTTQVKCFGNKDGSIRIYPKGGTGKYEFNIHRKSTTDTTWHPITLHYDTSYSSFDTVAVSSYQSIDTLPSDTFIISVRDTNSCYAKDYAGFGHIITDTVQVGQPIDSIRVLIDTFIQPLGFGFNNGKMHLRITGGTPSPKTGLYNYQWTDQNGNPKSVADSVYINNGVVHIAVTHMSMGYYVLKIQDTFYTRASPNVTCSLTSQIYMPQPGLLTATFQDIPPNCNAQSGQAGYINNGQMIAHVTGGVRFNTGMPYIYSWKKLNSVGVWITLVYNDSVFNGIGAGSYKLNVTDANGIVIGSYVNNALVVAMDVQHNFVEPSLLTFTPNITPVGCTGTANGAINPVVSGGTSAYNYVWKDGPTTSTRSSLASGIYHLKVTDAKGCIKESDFNVTGTVLLSSNLVMPICHGGNTGSVTVVIQNIVPGATYNYNWVNPGGQPNVPTVNNLTTGTYTVIVTKVAPPAAPCQVRYQVYLPEPDLIPLNIPSSYTLCRLQTLQLDINQNNNNYTYTWKNVGTGFIVSNNSSVTLAAGGLYQATVYDWSKGGCIVAQQSINIITSMTDIDADLLLPTQAYKNDEVTMVDICQYPSISTDWSYSDHLHKTSETGRETKFYIDAVGTYPITMTKHVNQCVATITKDIIITENPDTTKKGDGYQPFILSTTVSPSPVSKPNTFTLNVKFREVTSANFKLYYMLGYSFIQGSTAANADEYNITFSTNTLNSGIYMILIETPEERKVLKIIVN